MKAQFGMGNTLAPLPGNKYPIIYSNDTKGGHHQVATITERNAIPALRRQLGMLCTVLDAGSGTPKTYQLIGGILDANWIEFSTASTESDPVFLAWDKSSGISIFSTQISDFETSVTNNSAVSANTAKNSYPLADAVKLAGIESGAEVNVIPDWNATSGDAQIMNKPTTISGYGITDAVGVSTIQSGTLLFASATGSANNYEVNLTPAPSGYTAGMFVNFKANFDNTAAATINVNGMGGKSIKKLVTLNLDASDIKNGQMVSVIYDGTNFQLLNPPSTLVYNNPNTITHGIQNINVAGSNIFTVPAGVHQIYITLTGSGGGGGGFVYVSGCIQACGGIGGAGGRINVSVSCVPGQQFEFFMGNGGITGNQVNAPFTPATSTIGITGTVSYVKDITSNQVILSANSGGGGQIITATNCWGTFLGPNGSGGTTSFVPGLGVFKISSADGVGGNGGYAGNTYKYNGGNGSAIIEW